MGIFVLYRGDPFLNDLYDENENKIERAAYTSFTGKLSFSYHILRNLSAGANVQLLYQQIPSSFSGEKVRYTSSTNIGSFDFALAYRWRERLQLCMLLKDAGAAMNWTFSPDYGGYDVPSDERMLPVVLLGSSFRGSLAGRPFIWNADVRGYFFTGEWKKIDRPQATLSNGWEWRYWRTVFLRMGIGEILLNGDITGDNRRYRRDFSFRCTGGIAVDMSSVRKGMRLNYGVSTDKLWAGIDQQLDVIYAF